MNNIELSQLYHSACRKVYLGCPNQYAKAYARSGLSLTNIDDQKQNALYVLSNLSWWRGKEAQDVRNFLRTFAEVK